MLVPSAANMFRSTPYANFFSTHYFYEGIRITVGIMVPVLLAARFNDIGLGLAMALGALCVSIADNAGPVHHRINGMLATIGFVFIASVATGYALPYTGLTLLLLGIFSFFFSIIGIFGNRAASIGTSVLIAITLQLTEPEKGIWQNALLTTGGGSWYFLLSILLHRIRPYKLAQQVLADCVGETGRFLKLKAGFYSKDADFDRLYEGLLKGQVEVHAKQEAVREILFKTRSIVKESTHTGRVLVLSFLEVVDIFEIILTSEQDYRQLRASIPDKDLLEEFSITLSGMAQKMQDISIAIQEGEAAIQDTSLAARVYLLETQYENSRHKFMQDDNARAYIALRHVLSGIRDLMNRINNLAVFTTYDKKLKINRPVDYQRFVVPSYINSRLLLSNLSWQSNIFRYSVRMMLAVIAAYGISLMFTIGHSYWIVLTVVVILKPAYALTRKRNMERLSGTFAGGLLGIGILFLVKDKNILLVLLIAFMVTAFSFIRTRYWLGVALLTTYVIISIYLLSPGDYTVIVKDRILDTFIGSVISFLFTRAIPPVWEKIQLGELLFKTIEANKNFLGYMLDVLAGSPMNLSQYKWYRKETYVALANLSDAFQRMLNEPKNRQESGEFMYPLVVSCHVLTSRNASLGRTSQIIQFPKQKPILSRINQSLSRMLGMAATCVKKGLPQDQKSIEHVQMQHDIRYLEHDWNKNSLPHENSIQPKFVLSQIEGIADLSYEVYHLSAKAFQGKI